MKQKSKKTIITVDAKRYEEVFGEFSIIQGDSFYQDVALYYDRFDSELGLKYNGQTEQNEYKFRVVNSKKWFLGKIKYGL
jgi:hypothetical protein